MAKHADASDELSESAAPEPDAESSQPHPLIEEVVDHGAGAEGEVELLGDDDVADTMSPARLATMSGLVVVVLLAALAGWLGIRGYQAQRMEQQRALLIHVARQGALNLTTIDWEHADDDIARILDSATGAFYDDFSKRSEPFAEIVKKVKSKSVGTIAEAGLESQSGDEAQVLVAVSVKTSNLAAADDDIRHWRMRISVEKTGSEQKISNVEFVP